MVLPAPIGDEHDLAAIAREARMGVDGNAAGLGQRFRGAAIDGKAVDVTKQIEDNRIAFGRDGEARHGGLVDREIKPVGIRALSADEFRVGALPDSAGTSDWRKRGL